MGIVHAASKHPHIRVLAISGRTQPLQDCLTIHLCSHWETLNCYATHLENDPAEGVVHF